MRSNKTRHFEIVAITLALVLAIDSIGYGQHHEKPQRSTPHEHRQQQADIYVVTSLPCYASVVAFIGGDLVTVESIATGGQDPHFVQPKPSYALKMAKADLFITTGLDLELWVPTLLDKARNKNILEGAAGYVSAATDVPLLEKPETNPDRAMGDVHLYGNPHIHTSPLNAKIIAENILVGLKRIAPQHAAVFEANYRIFVDRLDRALFGDELVEMFGGETLSKMLTSGSLINFLETKEYGGEKLINKLGGWLQKALPLRGRKIIAYHKNWIYFARDFGLEIVDYIEPKPGIPPPAKHVKELVEKIAQQGIQVMLVSKHFERNTANMIAERTGTKAVFVPLDVGGEPGVNTYFDLMDFWIDRLNEAYMVQSGSRD